MGVDLNGTCHDGLASGIDDFCTGADFVDNLTVLDGYVCFVTFDALDTGRIRSRSL